MFLLTDDKRASSEDPHKKTHQRTAKAEREDTLPNYSMK